ncbi:TetR/AcrR family transcriptional regulator [Shimia biformata]|uniref:TetR/AcrR family transcriptional regulator n=1 Tax=Shimia biformata TaxID=1294299 RepID=UPI0019526BAE|nr:TetR/AcrR family transcriptional regulator [Shimia biformata]
MSSTRLSPDRWIDAGFDALVSVGPSALKAESLARRLKTTKGSFYWHFADVPAYHAAMLQRWEKLALADLANIAEADEAPVQKLRHLAQFALRDSKGTEAAIRGWAFDSAAAAQAVLRLDEKRMAALAEVLEEVGLPNPELARIVQAANIGMAELTSRDQRDNAEALGTLVDLILALYD